MNTDFSIIDEVRRIHQVIDNHTHDIKVAVHETLVQKGEVPAYISLKKAQDVYGRVSIDNWVKWGLIEPVRDGEGTSKYRIEVGKLIMIAGNGNRNEYFKNKKL